MATFFEGGPPRVLAHRGLAVHAPENSMLAFAHALVAGADIIETDVRATSDGVAVIAHDETLERVAGNGTAIAATPWSAVKRIQLSEDQHVPTLAEALDAFPDARFNIDVKSDDAVGPTVLAILQSRATERVLVTSFSEQRRSSLLSALPGVASGASSLLAGVSYGAAALGLSFAVPRILGPVNAVQVPRVWRGIDVVTPRFIRALHAGGVEIHVWTVNDPAEIRRLFDLGVDDVITDRADLAAPIAREFASAARAEPRELPRNPSV